MKLTSIDWLVIISYLVISFAIGAWRTRRASRSLDEYFASGRSLPWWLVGTSMVATTFASDTPLQVTDFIRREGISGSWYIWCYVMSGVFAMFFYSRLWRRSGLLTDAEFYELRYSGKPASALRVIMALYKSIVYNAIVVGWVIEGMASICGKTLGWNELSSVSLLVGITLVYCTLSGLWGVVLTDLFQFVVAMAGSIALAIYSAKAVGGVEVLVAKVTSLSPHALNFFPTGSAHTVPMATFLLYITVQWWCGGTAEGSGYFAQRMFSARDDRHAFYAFFWFNIAQNTIRYWPWVVVALASLVVFPQVAKNQDAYPMMMTAVLPHGLMGLMAASLFAAFMSTVVTHFNWGASYLVSDVYKRHIKPTASERHYIAVSRVATIFMALLAGVVAILLRSIFEGWVLLLSLASGTGLIHLLRWYWWRVNAWAEIAALTASVASTVILAFTPLQSPEHFAARILTIVVVSNAACFIVMFLTQPETEDTLLRFYNKVRPEGGWWGNVAVSSGHEGKAGWVWRSLAAWGATCIFIFTSMFSVGKFVLGMRGEAVIYVAASLLALRYLLKDIRKIQSRHELITHH